MGVVCFEAARMAGWNDRYRYGVCFIAERKYPDIVPSTCAINNINSEHSDVVAVSPEHSLMR